MSPNPNIIFWSLLFHLHILNLVIVINCFHFGVVFCGVLPFPNPMKDVLKANWHGTWNMCMRFSVWNKDIFTKAQCSGSASTKQQQLSKGNGFARLTELKCWKFRKEGARFSKQHYLCPGFYSFWKSKFSAGRAGQWAPAQIPESLCRCWRALRPHPWWGTCGDKVLLLVMDVSAGFCRPFLHEKRMQRNCKDCSSPFCFLTEYVVWTARQGS